MGKILNFRTNNSSDGDFLRKNHYEIVRLTDFVVLRHFSTKPSLLSSLLFFLLFSSLQLFIKHVCMNSEHTKNVNF